MGSKKQINIKHQTYYFYNDIIDIETFDVNLLKIDKKTYKDIDIFNFRYVKKKKIDDCININSVNPLYLRIDNASGDIEEINKDQYLVFDVRDENKKLLKRYDVFNGIMVKIKEIDDDWLEYSKDYTKIKFNSDVNLPLNKQLKFYQMTVTIRYVFSEDNKLYPQVFLDETLYSLKKMLKYDRIDISEGIDVDKTNESRECKFSYENKIKTLVMVHLLVMVVMI